MAENATGTCSRHRLSQIVGQPSQKKSIAFAIGCSVFVQGVTRHEPLQEQPEPTDVLKKEQHAGANLTNYFSINTKGPK